MVGQLPAISILSVMVLLCACKSGEKYSYAIKDFKKEYRPYLEETVSKNLVGYDTSTRFIKEHLSDKELLKLSNSEHPTLRAVALEELIERNSVDQYNVIKNHLDDTAIVVKDMGEFGVRFITVSDNMIMETNFKDSFEKQKVIELVMTEHSYLSSAYSILTNLNHVKKYYLIILDMTKRERSYEEISDALFALASYKKQSDIPFIREKLSKDRLLKESFYLIREFPDSSYFPLLEKYSKRINGTIYSSPYREIARNQEDAINFINTLASYKNKRSAEILAGFLYSGSISNFKDTVTFRNGINDAIIANNCPEYSTMIKDLSGYILKKKKDSINNSKYQSDLFYDKDTTIHKEIVRWPRISWP